MDAKMINSPLRFRREIMMDPFIPTQDGKLQLKKLSSSEKDYIFPEGKKNTEDTHNKIL